MTDLVSVLDRWAEEEPERLLYQFLNGAGQVVEAYSYGRLRDRSRAVAASLAETGSIRFGQPVLLSYPPGLEVAVAFFACIQVGAIPVPVPPPETAGSFLGGLERLAHIQHDCGAEVALTTSACLERLRARAEGNGQTGHLLKSEPLSALRWLASDTLPDSAAPVSRRINPLLFLQYTSGSTRVPRGVMVSHENVLNNCQGVVEPRPINVWWLPPFHDMGLIGGFLLTLFWGGTGFCFSANDFLRRPLLWLQTITRARATHTPAPNFAYAYCLRQDKVPNEALATLDLSSMRRMISGAEPVDSQTFTQFQRRFGPCGLSPDALVAAYGLAENSLVVSMNGRQQVAVDKHLLQRNRLRVDPARGPDQRWTQLVSSGKPIPGVEVRIVETATRTDVGENGLGEIWVRGGSKALGYWNKPELSGELFEASLAGEPAGPGFLRTGDSGFFHAGELFVCGRLKDLIIVRGKKFYPQDVEAVVESSCPEIRPHSVAAFAIETETRAEALAVVAEVRRRTALPDLAAICEAIRAHCLLDARLLALVPAGSLAKTSSGKIARQECKRRWLAGEMELLALYRHAPEATTDQLLRYLLDDFALSGSPDRTLPELGVDSLGLVDISLAVHKFLQARGYTAIPPNLDWTVLQSCKVGELRQLITDAVSEKEPEHPLGCMVTAKIRAIQQAERACMRQDAILPAEITPRGAAPVPINGKVLLTGATGFFGAFVLEALLRLTRADVVVLVRAPGPEAARRRIEQALTSAGLWDETIRETARERVQVCCGDLAQPQLGLSDHTWAALAQELTAVYHCGATVDYVKPYASLRDPNVAGTRELLRLACSGAPKAFHHVSSTFIFGWSGPRTLYETDCNATMTGLDFGYSQTKWVTEQLVLEAARRGLPVKLYRPSLISASRQGYYTSSDILARTLAYCIRHAVAVECINQMSLLPADVVANNLVTLSLLAEPASTTYHLTTDGYHTMPEITNLISRDFGYEFCPMALDDFVAHANAHCRDEELLYPLLPFLNTNHAKIERMREKRYDNTEYRQARVRCPATVPEPALEETVRAIVRFLQHESLIPAPPRTTTVPEM